MLEKGLLFTISTIRTPASLMEPMRDIHLKLPVIAMDGAVLYDMEEKMYRKVYVMSSSTSQKVLQLIRENGLSCFVNIIWMTCLSFIIRRVKTRHITML